MGTAILFFCCGRGRHHHRQRTLFGVLSPLQNPFRWSQGAGRTSASWGWLPRAFARLGLWKLGSASRASACSSAALGCCEVQLKSWRRLSLCPHAIRASSDSSTSKAEDAGDAVASAEVAGRPASAAAGAGFDLPRSGAPLPGLEPLAPTGRAAWGAQSIHGSVSSAQVTAYAEAAPAWLQGDIEDRSTRSTAGHGSPRALCTAQYKCCCSRISMQRAGTLQPATSKSAQRKVANKKSQAFAPTSMQCHSHPRPKTSPKKQRESLLA